MMTGDRELETLLRAVLRDVPPMPDRVLAEALARLPAVPQRRVRWTTPRPAWLPARHRSLALVIVATIAAAVLAAALLAVGQQPSQPLTFAPGSLAYVRGGALLVADADGSNERQVAEAGATGDGIGSATFSPAGSAIAYVDDLALHVRSADGRTTWTYPGLGGWIVYSWSPDGSKLAVASYSKADPHIVLLGWDGHTLGSLPIPADLVINPHPWIAPLPWSPDGQWIAVGACPTSTGCGINHGYYLLVATDGSGARWVTPDHRNEDETSFFAWAPDGTVTLPRWDAGSVVIADVDGTTRRQLVLPAGDKPAWGRRDLAWSNDGSRLAVLTEGPGSGLVVAQPAEVSTVVVPVPWTGVSSISGVHWSGYDGRLIIAATDPGGETTSIWSVGTAGEEPRKLLTGTDPDLRTLDVLR